MQEANSEELKAQVDRMLTGEAVDAQRLRIWVGGDEPDIDLLLYITEHPALAPLLPTGALSEDVEAMLVDAFSRAMPRLGMRAFGPVANLSTRARARLDAERRKYELVFEHMTRRQGDEPASVKLLRNYLGTAPAPLFVDALRAPWAEFVARAEDELERGVDLAVLVEDADLIGALLEPAQADFSDVAARLGARMAAVNAEVSGGPAMVDALLRRALNTGSADAKLMAAALATHDARIDLVADILGTFLAGGQRAPQFAVMAARLAPMMARNAFAQFLVDVAYQNPEEPEARVTADRTHTILSARSVLPLIGSPLPEVRAEELPDTEDFAKLRLIPALISTSWALWEQIATTSKRVS